MSRRRALIGLLATIVIAGASVLATQVAVAGDGHESQHGRDSQKGHVPSTTTPIQHVVVIFQENVSFDHYFATYPNAANTDGSHFGADPSTPSVNGLTGGLITDNPNSAQPFRLSSSQAETCDQDHNYTDEQTAVDGGLMDKYVETVGVANTVKVGTPPNTVATPCDYGNGKGLVMGYYDGNTVTGLWNYAQHFAITDNSYGTTFGPSTVGALNLVAGQTYGFTPDTTSFGTAVTANDTVIGDPQPAGDICSTRDTSTQLPASTDQNIGDLLNANGVTWGWFQGGFRETSGISAVTGQPTTNTCQIGHADVGGVFSADYIAHHEPFQYYRSTQNLQHLAPTSVSKIGQTDQANHQYDLSDFWASVDAHTMPAVSFLKAPGYQDGHAGYSDPLDEQQFLVDTINRLEKSSYWSSTAVIISYDDSDGWYDHQLGPIVNQSAGSFDALRGTDCGTNPNATAGGLQDRCGYGPRLPLLVVSPYAKTNYVDHSVTDQSSILRFIEDNWQTGTIGGGSFDALAGSLDNMFDFGHGHGDGRGGGAGTLFLDPATGEPTHH
jgi:phospholipase C